MNELECPYCKCLTEVELERDWATTKNDPHEAKCCHCHKNFVFHTEFVLTLHPKKADCLNGSPHQFAEWLGLPHGYEKKECKDCGIIIAKKLS